MCITYYSSTYIAMGGYVFSFCFCVLALVRLRQVGAGGLFDCSVGIGIGRRMKSV